MAAFWQFPGLMGQDGPAAKVPRMTDPVQSHFPGLPQLGMSFQAPAPAVHPTLASVQVNGFAAPSTPWEQQMQAAVAAQGQTSIVAQLATGWQMNWQQPEPKREAPVESKSDWNDWNSHSKNTDWQSTKDGDWDWGSKKKWDWKAKEDWNAAAAEASSLPAIDWTAQARNPFRREFMPYGPVNLEHAHHLRSSLAITVEHDPTGENTTPIPVQNFREIAVLPEWVMTAVDDNGWDKPTPIQAQALPIAVAGKDMIGIAQTGSGKTAAFLLPALVQIEAQAPLTRSDPGPIALILAPTRELAVQISDEAAKLMKHSWNSSQHPKGMHSAVFYGGGRKRDQLMQNSQEGAHIVVATPGRLLDFLGEGKVSLLRVTYLALDEADRMLDMGFAGDVRKISSQVRPERQAMFFSATWSSEVQQLARDFCSQDPVRIRVVNRRNGAAGDANGNGGGDENDDVLCAKAGITQEVIVVDLPGERNWGKAAEVKRRSMDDYVRNALRISEENKILVFVNEKKFADELVEKLVEDGFSADSIHGGRKQEDRLWVLDEFRKGNVRLLVATDVLGRGIDIPNVSHVVIFEMGSIEGYIHRIGRTARGKEEKGHALVFFRILLEVAQQCSGPRKCIAQVQPTCATRAGTDSTGSIGGKTGN
jgi:ATP-dependent RNA helicase DDX5/DBP2